ncbi:hypothetical protein ONE63_000911 [Megalurothrips usitatus]|nr:hypothetical protein ONE63_000911 [Megalurothrips usitatus]
MSFHTHKTSIEEGDTLMLYLSPSSLLTITVNSLTKNKHGATVENILQTTQGALKVRNLIGQKYGSRIELSKGSAYALHPTPELWTVTLPHRTQIIYTPDISMILFQLELRPGCIVIESGTGSGSLSHALIRAIKPSGHLYTFDFHEHRASVARSEFQSHGVGDFVTVAHQDVCQNGFGSEVERKADAVFLDLPHPWEAVPHAVNAMKDSGGRLCSFSPCMEQVQRTCEKLRGLGFVEISTLEVLIKEYQVSARTMSVMDLDSINANDNGPNAVWKDPLKIVSCNAPLTLAGHTGYLTVATLPPLLSRVPIDSVNGTNQG